MELDNLIQQIVSEVLRRINIEKKVEKRKTLFLEKKSEEIKLKYSLFITNWDQIHFIEEYTENIKDYDLIICPNLSMTDLVDIANGRPDSKISSIIIEAILNGVKVKCLEEGIYYRQFKSTANANFYSTMVEYENKLISYGIEIVKCSQIEEDFNSIQEKNKSPEKDTICLDKRVITKLDIERLYDNSYKQINIKEGSLITPLAEEYIRMKHIELKRV